MLPTRTRYKFFFKHARNHGEKAENMRNALSILGT